MRFNVTMGLAGPNMASIAALPLGLVENEREALGISMIAGAGQEGKILRGTSNWEKALGARSPAPKLVNRK